VEQGAHSFGAMSSCLHCGAPFTAVVAGQMLCDRCQGLAHPEPRSPLQEAEIAGFRLLHELGAGRFSHSWLGEDPRSHAVVVKLLRRYAPDPEAVSRFVAEAERLYGIVELDHPYVARPLSAGVHLVQAFFLVYESGGELTLADELRQRGRVRAARALELCAQICEGLGAMHRGGVLHLDLKPANVGLTRLSDGTEHAVVLDAVTSHLLHHVDLRDGHPVPIATAAYTAPEQAAGAGADVGSDLYSVGVLLFQLLSGRLPVSGSTPQELLRAHRDHATLRLRDIGRRVHPELEDTVARLMAKDPADRPESGDEAAVMLRAMAALAEATPLEDVHQDDPVPRARLRPAAAAPPQMLPPAVDPGLERAMLGHVSPAPERAPGVPKWAAFVPPRWWPAAAGVALAMVAVAVLAIRTQTRASAPAAAGLAVPPSIPSPASSDAAPPAAIAAVQPEPARPSKVAQNAASPWAKNFDRAQKALWTNRPGGAQTILRDILKKPGLTRRDRARASRMMGEAEAKKGNRAKASQWWRQAFQLFDDPEERAKVARMIQSRSR
jgi:eukaryotic-like serine/threonine-protein kinase